VAKGHLKRNVAVLAVVVVIVILLFLYVIPVGPHDGFVSESQASSITKQNYTSSSSTSSSSGSQSTQSRYYNTSSGGYLLISVAKFNSSASAEQSFASINTSLSTEYHLLGINLNSGNFRGFKYEYTSISLLLISLSFSAGIDGSYEFVIISSHYMSNNTMSSLSQAQISAMTSL
jgi:hypothetical protein